MEHILGFYIVFLHPFSGWDRDFWSISSRVSVSWFISPSWENLFHLFQAPNKQIQVIHDLAKKNLDDTVDGSEISWDVW